MHFRERIAVHITKPALRAVRQGHPWVFASGIQKTNKAGSAGDLAVLFDESRKFVGLGLWDPDSPIPVRVLHCGKQCELDADWLGQRLATVLEQRAELDADPTTTGYRLVHGENDRLPGLVVDRYASTLVAKLDTVAWAPHMGVVAELLAEILPYERLVLRLNRSVQKSRFLPALWTDGMVLAGTALQGAVVFAENGLLFEAEPVHGQKTGFFLDQRDNRERVRRIAAGKSVLNVFAYNGGFSIYAAAGGATRVASLDISRPAMQALERNWELNVAQGALGATEHDSIVADAFDALPAMAERQELFDIVILDPPSFAHKQADVSKALRAYEKLARVGLAVLKPEGTLVSASCSARVPARAFYTAVHSAAASVAARLLDVQTHGHARDHPIGFPEGAYLKCMFARKGAVGGQ